MSQEWADRHRRTRKLIRAVADKLFVGSKITPQQLYGFCRLTWVGCAERQE
jgi:hypothetical protein